MRAKLFWPIVVLVLLVANGLLLYRQSNIVQRMAEREGIVPPIESQIEQIEMRWQGEAVPVLRFSSLDGQEVKISDNIPKKEYTILALFGGTRCTKCFSLFLPPLSDLFRKHFSRLNIAVVVSREHLDEIRRFRQVLSLQFPILVEDPALLSGSFGLNTSPLALLVNSHGRIVAFHIANYNNEGRTLEFLSRIEKFLIY